MDSAEPLDLDALVRHSAAMCRMVAREDLRGVPLYLVLESRMPPEYRATACDGHTDPILDLQLEKTIGADWRGRGVCVGINDAHLVAGGVSYPDAKRWLNGLVLHELAHCLERRELFGRLVSNPYPTPAELHEMGVWMGARFSDPSEVEARSFRDGHRPAFFRILVHLCRRAESLGYDLDAWKFTVGGGLGFRTSPFERYERAMGHELSDLRGATFREIKSRPIPLPLVALWMTDAQLHPGNDAIDALIRGAQPTT